MADNNSTLKEVTTGGVKYVRAKELAPNTEISGTYKEMRTNPRFGGKEYVIDEGDILTVVNGSGQLNKLMEKVAPGSKVRILYLGAQKMQGGRFPGKEAHAFKVWASEGKSSAAAARPALVSTSRRSANDDNDDLL